MTKESQLCSNGSKVYRRKNTKNKQVICGNRIKAGFFNVIIQDIYVHGTND